MVFDLPGTVAFFVSILTIGLIYSILTLGLNLHFGYTGLLNFGHVAFFAVGAYTTAIITSPPPNSVAFTTYEIGFGVPMPWAFVASLVLGAVAGGALAFLIGLTSIRLHTHYLAIATFALAELVHSVIENEEWLTGGFLGMSRVSRPYYGVMSGDDWEVMYLVVVSLAVVGTYLFLERLIDSPFGRLLRGIRDHETRAKTLGKNTNMVKLKSFTIGGAIAGFAGGLYAMYIGSLIPGQFTVNVTFLTWVALLIGGAVSNVGAIFGTLLFYMFGGVLRFLPSTGDPTLVSNIQRLVMGLLFIVVIRVRPQGLFGKKDEIITGENQE